MEKITLGILSLHEAKDLKNKMEIAGGELFLVHNEKTCTRGCSVTVEVHVLKRDLALVQNILKENFRKNAMGLEFDPEILDSIYDPAKATATCPACGLNFETSHSECPDCGLRFS